ncbi:uncharacterized protein LOC111634121 isoform X3 [Centruroides sculpturatus]|uniref:uncharacterized protein LOC111634121 isoform X3 n=1 Tax=Centruroides sculpturatus TaxID=218467 RepID=UPI000C6DF4C5|nr:uncharacterized protein LOC111634121 isoform X3 [Centruroides sculpturatus]
MLLTAASQGTQHGTATVVVSSQSLLADDHIRNDGAANFDLTENRVFYLPSSDNTSRSSQKHAVNGNWAAKDSESYQSIQNRAVNVVFKLQSPPAGQGNTSQGMQNGLTSGHTATTTASGSLISTSQNIPITVTPDFPLTDSCNNNNWNGASTATGTCSMGSTTGSDLDSSKQSSNFAWNSRSVKLLITLFGEHKIDFYDSNKKKKGVWAQISQQMREKGYPVTADACDTKWRNMLKTFRKTSEHNKQAGKKVRKSPFYDEMMEALRNTPGAESSGVLDTNRLKTRPDETESEQQRPKKKRTNELITWLDTKKKEQQKQEKEKMQILMQMHKEKMELMSALIQVLKDKKESQ